MNVNSHHQELYEQALKLHENNKGKLSVEIKTPVTKREDLALVYTPGVGEPSKRIAEHKENVYKYTIKGNTVAVISDGSAVLGLGNIGPEAAIPVMEGKALLFKEFAGIDAFPICINAEKKGEERITEIVDIIKKISPVFGGINLEDIKAPECFEIENQLQDLGIPVMHDDQHGTAVVVLAALINALKVVNKKFETIHLIIMGAGAAGTATVKLLLKAGVKNENMIVCDRKGAIYTGREIFNDHKEELAKITNSKKIKGSLAEVMKGKDVFIGVSVANMVTKEMAASMNKNAIVIAMANPVPEIMPDIAKQAGITIIATGRSDFPNQVNNALAFPGIFRGALDVRATRITERMKIAAAHALAGMVKKPTADTIMPDLMDKTVPQIVAEAVKKAWLSK